MKKYHYLYVLAILALIVALPPVSQAHAEDGETDAAVTISASTSAEVEVRHDDEYARPKPGLPMLRNAIRAKAEDIQANEDARNKLLGKFASSTHAELKDVRQDGREEMNDDRIETRMRIMNASTSQERTDLRRDMFEARKNILVRQLNLALSNLKQIRDRIVSRITKAEESGRTLTEAKVALENADAQIVIAQESIDALIAFTPEVTASTTVAIDLSKPRELGETAIKAVKDVQKALNEVIVAIAHAMGLKLDVTATTSASTTP